MAKVSGFQAGFAFFEKFVVLRIKGRNFYFLVMDKENGLGEPDHGRFETTR
jgi:hypothetical protein